MILALAALALAQTVTVDGACPGPLTLTLGDLAPDGAWALVSSSGAGDAAVPAGPCTGTRLDLDPASLALRGRGDSGDGEVVLAVAIPPAGCGAQLQLLDGARCTVSEVAGFGRPGVEDGRLWTGATERVVRREGIDGTGPIDVRCAEWDGEVCADLRVGTPRDGCAEFAGRAAEHGVVWENRPDERACPLLCAASTGGNEAFTVCEPGAGVVRGVRRACSWADPEPVCSPDDWYWRTDVSTMGDPWVVNVRLGDCYPEAPPLRLRCSGWLR